MDPLSQLHGLLCININCEFLCVSLSSYALSSGLYHHALSSSLNSYALSSSLSSECQGDMTNIKSAASVPFGSNAYYYLNIGTSVLGVRNSSNSVAQFAVDGTV